MNSFLPSTISAWNSLPVDAKAINNIIGFKSYLYSDKPKTLRIFYYGKRRLQVLHTRLRNDCSSLNHHLYVKNILPSPFCMCGRQETTYHYLFICPLFTEQRQNMFNTVQSLTEVTLRCLLYGDDTLTEEQNNTLFDAVHRFIYLSNKFESQ